jgi:hypothetical protein
VTFFSSGQKTFPRACFTAVKVSTVCWNGQLDASGFGRCRRAPLICHRVCCFWTCSEEMLGIHSSPGSRATHSPGKLRILQLNTSCNPLYICHASILVQFLTCQKYGTVPGAGPGRYVPGLDASPGVVPGSPLSKRLVRSAPTGDLQTGRDMHRGFACSLIEIRAHFQDSLCRALPWTGYVRFRRI